MWLIDWVYHRILDYFPNEWWHLVERDILRCFPGLEQIEIQISVEEMSGLPIFTGAKT